jgi:hypothetical protein
MMKYSPLVCIQALFGLPSCISLTMRSIIARKRMYTCVPLVLNHQLSMKDNFQHQPIMKTIWVFRTSVTMQVEIRRLKPILDRLMYAGDKWNFDLEDCDHILRVETQLRTAAEIIYELEIAGYECAELEDNSSLKSCSFIPVFEMN